MISRHSIVEQDLREIVAAPLDWKRFKGKTILISGASGFLPAYMAETLLYLNEVAACGCKVVGVVRNIAKAQTRFAAYSNRDDLQLIHANISEPLCLDERCDFVVHAASQASPKYFGVDPVGTMAANLQGSYFLLDLARKWQSEGFLLFSTGEVYGQVTAEKVPTTESDYGYIDILAPRSCYAESKRAAETLVASFVKQYQINGTIVRPFHTYGPGMALDDGRIFADLVRDVVNRRNLTLHSDGKAVRAFCYLADAVRGFFTVLLKGERGQAYNVGNPSAAISILDLANLLVAQFSELRLKVVLQGARPETYLPSSISINSPNIDRIARLGWRPHYSPEHGFERTVRYFIDPVEIQHRPLH